MVRNIYELKLIRESGRIASAALKKALQAVEPGTTELEVDKIAEDEIYKLGGDLSYKSVAGYKFATCITVNEQVVHGIPTQRKFQEGDLVSVDLAVEYRGWHTDCAWSVLVSGKRKAESGKGEKEKFLTVGQEALWDGISQAVEGNRVGDISQAIQTKVEGGGFSVVRSLVGHGVGISLHEEPEIPGYGEKGTGMFLKSGMALAIEVIYAQGGYEVVLQEDGWTYATADKSLGGLFEMTVIVGKKKAEVLTAV
jgi:methionyl aminopeptidase